MVAIPAPSPTAVVLVGVPTNPLGTPFPIYIDASLVDAGKDTLDKSPIPDEPVIAPVPFPFNTPVRVVAPVPPSATAKVPVIDEAPKSTASSVDSITKPPLAFRSVLNSEPVKSKPSPAV